MSKFKVGDKVMHLSHGFGEISSIEKREFPASNFTEFYVITIQDNGAPKRVFVPIENAAQRLRPIMDKKQALKVIELLNSNEVEPIDSQTWSRRYREYMEIIHSGDTKSIVKVYKSLKAISDAKDLSFGERKLMEQAKNLLETELNSVVDLTVINW